MSSPSPHRALQARLESGLAALGITLDPSRCAVLLAYVELLAKWNRVYNLTGVRDPLAMMTRHVLDSLAVSPYLAGPRLLDVGTGAGLPGMVLALAWPEREWVLLDSNAKKARFLIQAIVDLGPENVEVVRSRIEAYAPDRPFSTVISRALGSLARLVEITRHVCGPETRLLAMKGTYPQAEIVDVQTAFPSLQVRRLEIPCLAAERHLVVWDLKGDIEASGSARRSV